MKTRELNSIEERTARIITSIAFDAARESRYQAPAVMVRPSACEDVRQSSGVELVDLHITTDHTYTVCCTLDLRGATGQMAYGIGVAVKGRLDRFNALHGAKRAMRRAFRMAFVILGQKEGDVKPRRGELPAEEFLMSQDRGEWTGLDMLHVKGA